jgi:rare lipoprotein A (peptidoglycan hydrolase)
VARIDDYEPEDIEMTWGYDDEGTPQKMKLPRPRVMDRHERRSWVVVFAGSLLVALVFGMGSCTGSLHGRNVARDAVLELEAAVNSGEQAKDAAAYWQQQADEASSSMAAIESDLASMTADCLYWRQRAQEASETIGALRQQKATKLRAQAIQTSAATTETAGWATAKASWYGPGFYGNTMAGGGTLQPDSMVVAHLTLPFGTLIRFRYNGRECVAEVRDRGPYIVGRIFDLGPGTASALGFSGVGTVSYRIGG